MVESCGLTPWARGWYMDPRGEHFTNVEDHTCDEHNSQQHHNTITHGLQFCWLNIPWAQVSFPPPEREGNRLLPDLPSDRIEADAVLRTHPVEVMLAACDAHFSKLAKDDGCPPVPHGFCAQTTALHY